MNKLINDIKRGKLANCITLHDFSIKKPDLKKWTEYVVSLFKKYGVIPTRLGGHSKTVTKNINFKNGLRKLEVSNFDADHIWIGALPPEHNSDMFCAIFSAGIDLELGRICTSLVFDNDIVGFNVIELNKIASDLVKITGAKYGYIHQRDFTRVVGYEWGIGSGNEYEYPDSKFLARWGKVYRSNGIYKTGDMRDIYPINIISSKHLNRDVGGQTLGEWIDCKHVRGKLVQLDKDLWSWHVEFDDIENVRESLRDTGIILCI